MILKPYLSIKLKVPNIRELNFGAKIGNGDRKVSFYTVFKTLRKIKDCSISKLSVDFIVFPVPNPLGSLKNFLFIDQVPFFIPFTPVAFLNE